MEEQEESLSLNLPSGKFIIALLGVCSKEQLTEIQSWIDVKLRLGDMNVRYLTFPGGRYVQSFLDSFSYLELNQVLTYIKRLRDE